MNTATRKLLHYIRPRWRELSLATLIAVFGGGLDQWVPTLVRHIVNDAASSGFHPARLLPLVGCIAGVQALRIAQRLATERAATHIRSNLLRHGMHHLLSHPMSWFSARQNHSGALQGTLVRGTDAIAELLKLGLSDVLPPAISVCLSLWLIAKTSQKVSVVAALTVVLFTVVTLWQTRNQSGIRVSINDKRKEQDIRIAEAVRAVDQVKLFRAEVTESSRFGRVALRLADVEYAHHVAMAAFDALKFLVERGGYVLVLLLALSDYQRLGPGGILMVTILWDRVAEPVQHLHRVLDQLQEKSVLSRDFLALLDKSPVERQSARSGDPLRNDLPIAIENLTFAYPGSVDGTKAPCSLKDVAFAIPPGSRVAIRGESGCGKSTLAMLLAGLYVPSAGKINIAGAPVLPVESPVPTVLVGMLSQRVRLFAGTIAENIAYGRPDASETEIMDAAKIAGIDKDIRARVGSYQSMVEEDGLGLSGGQRQRIALARLILFNPDVVIFDEPTSALDQANAQRFFAQVIPIFTGKTVIVITHDDRNLHWATMVVTMKDGRIAQTV